MESRIRCDAGARPGTGRGDDARRTISAGPLPIAEALHIAHQIAEALEAAHERGIVHRDLKPANIKLRADGTVKVLDFGLARALEPTSKATSPGAQATVTSPAVTAFGVILGTAAYMSPEQACGQSLDRGTDIWAFGAVLFEMLTGSRAFQGSDPTQTVASVLRSEPDWSGLPPARQKAFAGCCGAASRKIGGTGWRTSGMPAWRSRTRSRADPYRNLPPVLAFELVSAGSGLPGSA